MSHPVLAAPVWKLPLTVFKAQLPMWTLPVCPFYTSKSSSLSKTTQFTLGPSIDNCKNFDYDNPEIDSRMHVKRLSAFGLSKNLESKYRVTTILVVLLKNLMFTSIWYFCRAVFRLSSNESENCGEELICPRSSALQYGAIPYKIMSRALVFPRLNWWATSFPLNMILKIFLILLHEL